MCKSRDISRKDFIKTSVIAGAGLAAMPFSITEGRDRSKVRIGMIGVGGRGMSHVRGLLKRSDVDIPAVCDVREEHAEQAKELIVQSGREAPELYTGGKKIYSRLPEKPNYALPIPIETKAAKNAYKPLIARGDLDAVIIATPWRFHRPIAVDAMEAGKYVGLEVPGVYTIDGCWDLVNVSEKTGMPCMMLENVCYRRDVMAILNMVRQGVFGEMLHGCCGYQHHLPALLDKNGNFGPLADLTKTGERAWRTYHHILRNGDLYPTHGIGPVAHWMDINRGNRFVKLTSTSTKADGLHKEIVRSAGKDSPNASIQFKTGDVVTTTITTARGESIIITLNTTVPRPYSLGFRCQGTNGVWNELDKSIFLRPADEAIDYNEKWESFHPYREKYDAPLYKKYASQSEGAGHGGMDWYIRNAFVQAVKHKTRPPIDVYDTATWAAIGPLSEESISQGGAPVDFPDFTDGRWLHSERIFNIKPKY